ncbi:hypothetical protein BD289DRAFT_110968 [Coniella lustricola]|uniref:Uncharacterized protein n=1 Tax=Coniella lustricola TaxID=2025994 RepID=A0A2T2ZX84_9PEZI|nr:hypothetical protein BD289DRAFT_110968 [Coniella lustricola]
MLHNPHIYPHTHLPYQLGTLSWLPQQPPCDSLCVNCLLTSISFLVTQLVFFLLQRILQQRLQLLLLQGEFLFTLSLSLSLSLSTTLPHAHTLSRPLFSILSTTQRCIFDMLLLFANMALSNKLLVCSTKSGLVFLSTDHRWSFVGRLFVWSSSLPLSFRGRRCHYCHVIATYPNSTTFFSVPPSHIHPSRDCCCNRRCCSAISVRHEHLKVSVLLLCCGDDLRYQYHDMHIKLNHNQP